MTGVACLRRFALMSSGSDAFAVSRVSKIYFSVTFMELSLKIGGSLTSGKVVVKPSMLHC